MVTVRVAGVNSRSALKDVEKIVGGERLFRKGTDPDLYVNYTERLDASMAVIALNCVYGVKAHILGD